jgi:hypothetical protein
LNNTPLHIDQFSKHLFWDVRRSDIDPQKHKSYIVKQVLEYGRMKDWILIQNHYGIEQIASIAKELRDLDGKALSFISWLSKIPKEEFRCYNYQRSVPKHWNF